jgi:hypothetical protein
MERQYGPYERCRSKKGNNIEILADKQFYIRYLIGGGA